MRREPRVVEGIILESPEVVTGEEHELNHSFPECCMIGGRNYQGDGRQFLGCGVLVEPKRVVTAAHVIRGKMDISVSFENSWAAAVNTRNWISASTGYVHNKHARFNSPYDLAVLDFDIELQPIPASISQGTDPIVNEVTVVGYGVQTNRGIPTEYAKNYAGDIEMVAHAQMAHPHDQYYRYNPESQFVIGPRPCEADSGGPVYTSLGYDRKLIGIFIRKVNWDIYGTGTSNCQRDSICSLINKPINIKDYGRRF